MTDQLAATGPASGAVDAAPLADAVPRWQRRPKWWSELGLAVVFYLAYAAIRDLHGRKSGDLGPTVAARRHGESVYHLERILHIDFERSLQNASVPHHGFVKLMNGFYGGAHFAVTLAVFLALLIWAPSQFRRWRTVLAVGTLLGLVGFALLPTMPPRSLPPPHHLVDTLHVFGGLWSYDHGTLEKISDPYAAMPSLHLVWACWCAAVMWSWSRRVWVKVLAVLYPVTTGLVVMATGNHYLLDVVAGAAVFLVGVVGTLAVRRRLGWDLPAAH